MSEQSSIKASLIFILIRAMSFIEVIVPFFSFFVLTKSSFCVLFAYKTSLDQALSRLYLIALSVRQNVFMKHETYHIESFLRSFFRYNSILLAKFLRVEVWRRASRTFQQWTMNKKNKMCCWSFRIHSITFNLPMLEAIRSGFDFWMIFRHEKCQQPSNCSITPAKGWNNERQRWANNNFFCVLFTSRQPMAIFNPHRIKRMA